MSKRIIALLLAIVLCISCAGNAFALVGKDHWKEMRKVLFGNTNYPIQNKDKCVLLEKAVSLCIDQFSGINGNSDNGQEYYQTLKDAGIPLLPVYKDIDLRVNSNEHRMYTHLGWDNLYKDYKLNGIKNWQDKWENRRRILRNTVENVFNFSHFGLLDSFFVNGKREAFCRLIYTVHIIGDHEEYINSFSSYNNHKGKILPLAANHDDSIISEIKNACTVLFDDQNWSDLSKKLDNLNSRICTEYNKNSFADERYFKEHYGEYCNELMDILSQYIPPLLKKESFFADVFFS